MIRAFFLRSMAATVAAASSARDVAAAAPDASAFAAFERERGGRLGVAAIDTGRGRRD